MHHINRGCFKTLFGLVLLSPVTGWAHALSPSYYPLAQLPVFLVTEWWPFLFLMPLSIAVEAFVLWTWTRHIGILGCLWRAAILYVATRATETAAIFILQSVPLFRHAGWSSLTAENFWPLVMFLTAGLAVAVPVGLLLYHRSTVKVGIVVAAVCTASLAGYLSAFGFTLILMLTRGY